MRSVDILRANERKNNEIPVRINEVGGKNGTNVNKRIKFDVRFSAASTDSFSSEKETQR